MKATLLANGYVEVRSESTEERDVLNVIASEGIDLSEIAQGRDFTAITFRRPYLATSQANAAEEFRDEMLAQVYIVRDILEKLQVQLKGLWGSEADKVGRLPESEKE